MFSSYKLSESMLHEGAGREILKNLSLGSEHTDAAMIG